MPGFRGKQFSLLETELADLFPVHLDESQPRGWGAQAPAKFQLTDSGRNSLLTKLADSPAANTTVWRNLPGFQWYAPVLRSKAGTQTLAVHSSEKNQSGRIPLLVTKTYGSGKILFMGTDGAGDRLPDGWLISATWPAVIRCDCFTLPIDPKLVIRLRLTRT